MLFIQTSGRPTRGAPPYNYRMCTDFRPTHSLRTPSTTRLRGTTLGRVIRACVVAGLFAAAPAATVGTSPDTGVRPTGGSAIALPAAAAASRPAPGGSTEWLRRLGALLRARPRDIRIDRDVVYRTIDGQSLRLDAYRPAGPREVGGDRARTAQRSSLPALVYLHGGGWKAGDKAGSRALFYDMVRAGYVVFSVNYRLVPSGRFPRNVEDCMAAVRWVRLHAESYGVDPERIGIVGSSAGAHLAALVGMAHDDDFPTPDIPHVSAHVGAVVCFFGPFELRGYGEFVGGLINDYLGATESRNPEAFRRASPLAYVERIRREARASGARRGDPPPGLPAFLFIHGDADDLVSIEQSRHMHAALRSIHARSKLIEVHGGVHGLMTGEMSPSPAEFRRQMFDFLAEHLSADRIAIRPRRD